MRLRLVALAVSLAMPIACGGEAEPTTSPTTDVTQSAAPQRFDELDLRLELTSSEVASGGELATTLIVENRSGHELTDSGCQIGAGRYALIPVDERSAELWLVPEVDCSGPFVMADGFAERSDGPTFLARTKFGESLPPGDYIAALQIEGRSDRLEYPVQIT